MSDCDKPKDIDFTEGITVLINIARDLEEIFKRVKTMSVPTKDKVREKFREIDRLFIAQSSEILELRAALKLSPKGKCVVLDSPRRHKHNGPPHCKTRGKIGGE
ncbi:hypothetical protein CDAR_424361 [Caerostris darwini]|uniref:Uncharacterized protein n=1 Tax=Caerostris darwini TaxID=1538125 RepID=A0AAV4T1K9_9ARAC|nr:hypothetical protein CDAR_424361 [Caerostris darwini]